MPCDITYDKVQHMYYTLQTTTRYSRTINNYKAQNKDLKCLTVVASYSAAGRRFHIKVP